MLKEIRCDKFKNKVIYFHSGLNTILGDDIGSNSIGKTTFLLIIDFVFGGNSFLKAKEVTKEIGELEIKYIFCFNHKNYHFIRNTRDTATVYICNETFDILDKQSVDSFNEFLFEMYNIKLQYISFRELVSLYSRIYGKENDNENKPLNAFSKESDESAIIRLLKQFNLYSSIHEFAEKKKNKEDKLKAYKKAQKYEFISSITPKEYKENKQNIREINKSIEYLTAQISAGNINLETEQLIEISDLKDKLTYYRRTRSKNIAQIRKIEENSNINSHITNSDITALKTFFPDSNLQKISQINDFHNKIKSILSSEIKKQIKDLTETVNKIDIEIESIITAINSILDSNNPSKIAINKLLKYREELDALIRKNSSYENNEMYKTEKKDAEGLYLKEKSEQTTLLQQWINHEMNLINDCIYDETKKAPLIQFKDKTYNFYTPDDTGTGTSYKNMIVFDLSVLKLTVLPILIHDSIILKQVADEAIDKIMKEYESFKSKQIFIALDKKSSYLTTTKNILSKTTVLKLGPNGQELFGISWNKK